MVKCNLKLQKCNILQAPYTVTYTVNKVLLGIKDHQKRRGKDIKRKEPRRQAVRCVFVNENTEVRDAESVESISLEIVRMAGGSFKHFPAIMF